MFANYEMQMVNFMGTELHETVLKKHTVLSPERKLMKTSKTKKN